MTLTDWIFFKIFNETNPAFPRIIAIIITLRKPSHRLRIAASPAPSAQWKRNLESNRPSTWDECGTWTDSWWSYFTIDHSYHSCRCRNVCLNWCGLAPLAPHDYPNSLPRCAWPKGQHRNLRKLLTQSQHHAIVARLEIPTTWSHPGMKTGWKSQALEVSSSPVRN